MLESSQWPGAFFWTTMGSVVILNSKFVFVFFLNLVGVSRILKSLALTVAGGIYQNTIYGMSAKLPFKYTGAVVLGSVSLFREENNHIQIRSFYSFIPL